MTYVDGYVLAVPEKNLADYREMAERGAAAWKKHGQREGRGDGCILIKSFFHRGRIAMR